MSVRRVCLDCGNTFAAQHRSGRSQQGHRCPDCQGAKNTRDNRARHAKPDQKLRNDPAYRAIPKPYGKRCALQIPNVCTGWAETHDHITPLSKGGHILGPTRPACRACNSSRGNRT